MQKNLTSMTGKRINKKYHCGLYCPEPAIFSTSHWPSHTSSSYDIRHSIKSAFLFEKHCNTSCVFLNWQLINCLKIEEKWNSIERLKFLGEVFHCSRIPIFWPHWNLPRTIFKKRRMLVKSFLEYNFYFYISAIVYWLLHNFFSQF